MGGRAQGALVVPPLPHGSFKGSGRVPKKCPKRGIPKNSIVATFGPQKGPSWGLMWTQNDVRSPKRKTCFLLVYTAFWRG